MSIPDLMAFDAGAFPAGVSTVIAPDHQLLVAIVWAVIALAAGVTIQLAVERRLTARRTHHRIVLRPHHVPRRAA